MGPFNRSTQPAVEKVPTIETHSPAINIIGGQGEAAFPGPSGTIGTGRSPPHWRHFARTELGNGRPGGAEKVSGNATAEPPFNRGRFSEKSPKLVPGLTLRSVDPDLNYALDSICNGE